MPGPGNALNISESGYVTFDGVSTFHGRTFQAGTGITLTNSDGISGNTTIASTASLTDLHTARFIVASSTNGTGANFTTIAAAIASAQGTGINSTIFLQPGTYTENFTLPPGINLAAYTCDALTPNITIVGNITVSAAGTCSISGIRLQTNGAAFLTVSANAAIIVNMDNCFLNCTNATGISFSSASASAAINVTNCKSNLGTTGIGLFSHSSAGTMIISGLLGLNTGGSSTTSTCSAGNLAVKNSTINFPIAISSSAVIAMDNSSIDTAATNTTCLALTGTGNSGGNFCRYLSGSASSISVGAGTIFNAQIVQVNSTNTNAITGAGTLNYSQLSFTGTSSTVNVTTQNLASNENVPGFLAVLSANQTNKTGTGTNYTLICDTEVYDTLANYNNATGTFTAPIKGKYELIFKVYVNGCTVATSCSALIITTARTYANQFARAAGNQDFGLQVTCIADMAASDTATFVVSCAGEAGDTDDILGNNAPSGTFVQGRWLGTN